MKTEIIKQQILQNYSLLSQLAHVKPKEENLIPVWGLSYRRNRTSGFVRQIGLIKTGCSSVSITGNEIRLAKKPFYMTWNRVLKNINTMLQNIIDNIDNKDIVTKKIVNIVRFH